MAYEKKDNYPKRRKPGIYPEGTDKQLGLDNDDLEQFSLGQFVSIHRSNRVFLNKNQIITQEGTSDLLLEDIPIYLVPLFTPLSEANYAGGYARDTAYRFFSEVLVYRNSNNENWTGNFEDIPDDYTVNSLSGNQALTGFPYIVSIADFNRGINGNFNPNSNYGSPLDDDGSYVVTRANVHILDEDGNFDPENLGNSVWQSLIEWMEERQIELYNFLRESPIFAKENPNPNDETYGLYGTNNSLKLQFTENKQEELDVILNQEIVVQVQPIDQYNGGLANFGFDDDTSFFMKLKIILDRPTVNSNGQEITFADIALSDQGISNPNVFIIPKSIQGSSGQFTESDFFISNLITFSDAQEVWQQTEDGTYDFGFGKPMVAIDTKDDEGFYNAFIPGLLNDDFPDQMGDHNVLQPEREDYLRTKVGWPNFTIDSADDTDFEIESQDELLLATYEETTELTPEIPIADYQVYCFYNNDLINNNQIDKGDFQSNYQNQNFLYYDFIENPQEYADTSYPVQLNLIVDLFQIDDFINEQSIIDLEYYSDASSEYSIENTIINAASSPTGSLYRYKVISWGDEKIQLNDDVIENSFYFKMYDSEDFPSEDSYEYQKNKSSQYYDSLKIIEDNKYNVESHIYTTSGPKTIKLIIYRYSIDGLFLISSTLITKNININDGFLLSQDFSIFGGTDFKFLPLDSGSAIIGGIDEDSNYNNSVEKIKKDDNFIEEDYLERQSSRNYINNFNNGLFGESLSQLDLSLTRVFTKPIDLYYFIGAGNSDKRKEIRQNNFELNDINLPINSFATDIFIDDEDCVIDINPNEIEFGTVPNKKIASNKAILIGDYKLDQPKESRITKQGVMQIPLIENDSDKQAF